MKVFELISAAIAAEGCRTVFGVVGDGNLALWSAIARDRPTALRPAWHEGAAVAMADAYARSCGEVGVATVTCGPGLTHAATSLVTAVRHGSPLVLIAGDLAAAEIAGNQQLDQRGFAQACGARFVAITHAGHAAVVLRDAFREARARSCPVVISVPMDIQELEVAGAYRPAADEVVYSVTAPDPAGVEAVAELIAAAERPVIVAGRGALGGGTRDAIIELADRIGAALGTSLPAKGLFAGHPRDVGLVGGVARAATRRVLDEADLVLAMGTALGHHTTDRGTQFARARIVRVDLQPTGGGTGPASTIHLQGDAGAAARALSRALDRGNVRRTGFAGAKMPGRRPAGLLRDRPVPNDGMEPRRVMAEVSASLPPGVQVACGIGHFWSFPIIDLDLPQGGSFHSTHAFGAIGLALPFGLGLAAAAPDRPVLVIEGDGSLMQSMAELETAARHGISIVVLVMNDGGYGAEAHKMAARGFDGAAARWRPADFAAIASALGAAATQIEHEADLAGAVAGAFTAGGVQLIDARISPSVLSDLYLKTLFGQAIQ